MIQGRLPEGDIPSGNTSGIGDPIGGNPGAGGSPDVGIPPELGGSNGFGATPGVPPAASGTSPSSSGSASGNPTSGGNSSASSSQAESGEEGWLSGLWNKTKNYVASGQILKDAAHLGKETLDFLILDDVSGCFTGKDTDGNQLAGWERGLSCVSLVPAAKWVKLGKYADEALAFAGKLDDKLAKTRFGEGLQTAKRKLEDRFRKGKEVACGCDDNVGKKVAKNLFGSNGVKVTSKTIWKAKGSKARIDVENPNPGKRPGQIHYQDENNVKYYFDPERGVFYDQKTGEIAPKK